MSVVWLREKNGFTGTKYEEMDSQYNVEKGHATHVRITVKEYDDLLKRISTAKENAENAKKSNTKLKIRCVKVSNRQKGKLKKR